MTKSHARNSFLAGIFLRSGCLAKIIVQFLGHHQLWGWTIFSFYKSYTVRLKAKKQHSTCQEAIPKTKISLRTSNHSNLQVLFASFKEGIWNICCFNPLHLSLRFLPTPNFSSWYGPKPRQTCWRQGGAQTFDRFKSVTPGMGLRTN